MINIHEQLVSFIVISVPPHFSDNRYVDCPQQSSHEVGCIAEEIIVCVRDKRKGGRERRTVGSLC